MGTVPKRSPTASRKHDIDATPGFADALRTRLAEQLVAHRNGDPLNRIAAAVGVHHSAVKRVLDAADANSQRYLLAAS